MHFAGKRFIQTDRPRSRASSSACHTSTSLRHLPPASGHDEHGGRTSRDFSYEKLISAAASRSGGRPGCGAGAGTSRQVRPCAIPHGAPLSKCNAGRRLMSSARSQVRHPCGAGCAQHRLAAACRHSWQQRTNSTAPRQQDLTRQAAAPGCRRAPQSSRITSWACPCASNAHGLRKHVVVHLCRSCSRSA